MEMRWLLLVPLLLACDGATPAADAGPTDAGTDAGPVDAGPLPPSVRAEAPLVQWVDPFLGTGGSGFNDLGSAFPGPQRPFGMVRPSPDTAEPGGAPVFTHCAGYAFEDDFITGFSQTRMHGTGIADYGHVALLPVPEMEDAFVTQEGAMTRKSDEEASPGYYAVTLERGAIRAELTATERVAFHRYTFGAGPQAVLVDVGHRLANDIEVVDGSVTVDPEAREVHGMARIDGGYSGRFGGVRMFFVARFDRAFEAFGTWEGETRSEGVATASGGQSGAWVSFGGEGEAVEVAVAMSFVDVEGARANLEAELGAFDDVRADTEAAWETLLSRVRIEGRDEGFFRRFYTALYHSLLMPTLATDVDGRYRGVDDEIHTADGFTYYTDFSLWDTYRTLHPLLTLLYPEIQLDFLRSLTAMAVDGGAMPRWPLGHGYTGGMLGEPAAIVMADSWRKGLTDFDLRAAYDAMRRGAFGEASPAFGGRGNAELYDRLGYVPVETGGWSASKTMEFAYADGALAHLADALGETDDAARFRERAGSYRNIWDAERGFFLGRHEDGSFTASFREDRWQDFYSEGNAWQYLWLAPHDVDGLVAQLGGRDTFLERLRLFFEQSARERRTAVPPTWYWHGNEPDMHAAYLFTAVGEPAESARWSRWVADAFYGDGPTGLPGNDDGGTMSAWYVFTGLGFFPFAGGDDYLLGSPRVTRAELTLDGGTFVIEAPESSERAPIPTEVTLDDAPLEGGRIPHADLRPGSTLRLMMSGE